MQMLGADLVFSCKIHKTTYMKSIFYMAYSRFLFVTLPKPIINRKYCILKGNDEEEVGLFYEKPTYRHFNTIFLYDIL